MKKGNELCCGRAISNTVSKIFNSGHLIVNKKKSCYIQALLLQIQKGRPRLEEPHEAETSGR